MGPISSSEYIRYRSIFFKTENLQMASGKFCPPQNNITVTFALVTLLTSFISGSLDWETNKITTFYQTWATFSRVRENGREVKINMHSRNEINGCTFAGSQTFHHSFIVSQSRCQTHSALEQNCLSRHLSIY